MIQNMWGPVCPPQEARVGQSAVVNCSPVHEEQFLLGKFFFKLNNSPGTRAGYSSTQGRDRLRVRSKLVFEA